MDQNLVSQNSSQMSDEVTEKVVNALKAYHEFMEFASKFEKEEEEVFRRKIKEREDKKIEDLRKKLMEI